MKENRDNLIGVYPKVNIDNLFGTYKAGLPAKPGLWCRIRHYIKISRKNINNHDVVEFRFWSGPASASLGETKWGVPPIPLPSDSAPVCPSSTQDRLSLDLQEKILHIDYSAFLKTLSSDPSNTSYCAHDKNISNVVFNPEIFGMEFTLIKEIAEGTVRLDLHFSAKQCQLESIRMSHAYPDALELLLAAREVHKMDPPEPGQPDYTNKIRCFN